MVMCRDTTDPRAHCVFTNARWESGNEMFIGCWQILANSKDFQEAGQDWRSRTASVPGCRNEAKKDSEKFPRSGTTLNLSAAGGMSIKNGLAISGRNSKRVASKDMSARPASMVTDDVETPDSLVMSKSAGLRAARVGFLAVRVEAFGDSVYWEGDEDSVKGEISFDRRRVRIQIALRSDHGVLFGSAGSHGNVTGRQERKDSLTQ
ncbi:hypothetical protein FPANT_467 [Fusarium pseudoanthophilum]|uniref:Uncharacterized protein n=1 Tax=Fusarium pseudoanthophilum TaxID=48495 RepID=A0A8H5Q6R9_9HYPO|nr:hypothetical protein FPANT_467 [Fusarium pseudoanthophilum]